MTNLSGDMAETSVTDFFTLPKLGRFHQCLDLTMPQKWSGEPMDRVEIDAYADSTYGHIAVSLMA